ncbi:MAG: hypothetical protein L0H70_02620 [Xanthomonadales bacterium]|nr:hypothetical protein [Xanthomonadales bacterium]
MNNPTVSVTTLGLRDVDERLVKSLLSVLDGRTHGNWLHVDGLHADVAICEPDHPLAEQARDSERSSGHPLCVALRNRNEYLSDWSRMLHRPICMRELQDAMIAVASELQVSASIAHNTLSPRPANVTTTASPPRHESLVSILRRLHLHRGNQNHVVRVIADRDELFVHLPQGKIYFARGFSEAALTALSAPHRQFSVQTLNRDQVDDAMSSDWVWLDSLLWRMGLLGRGGSDLGQDPQLATYHLDCWPDLGKIPSNPLHIRLTALFSRHDLGIDAAAKLLDANPDEVRIFLRACACCGILKVSEHAPAMAAAKPDMVPVPKRRVTGMFNMLRTALGMGH